MMACPGLGPRTLIWIDLLFPLLASVHQFDTKVSCVPFHVCMHVNIISCGSLECISLSVDVYFCCIFKKVF